MVLHIEKEFKKDKVNLYLMGDTHIGTKNFAKDELIELVSIIKEDKYASVILMGDLIDAIVPTDKRFDIDNISQEYNTIEKQYVGIKKLLEPIKGKIIGTLMGNHDDKIRKLHGWNIPQMMMDELGGTYLGEVGTVKLFVKKQPYNILLHHGSGGASTIAGQINNMRKYAENMESCPDIIGMGHFHRIDVVLNPRLTDKFETKIKYLAITGSFYRTYVEGLDNYSNKRFMSPLPIGCVKFELFSNGEIKDHKIIL